MSVVLYLDTSALVKQYVLEPGSEEVAMMLGEASLAGSSSIARVEMEAALAKYVRMNALSLSDAEMIATFFRHDWELYTRIMPDEMILNLATRLVWHHALRGYDALHLATALKWQDVLLHPIVFATFDKCLWQAASDVGLTPFPDDLTPFLAP